MTIRALRIVGPTHGTTGYARHVREYIRCFRELGIELELLDPFQRTAQPDSAAAEYPTLQPMHGVMGLDATIHFTMPPWANPWPTGINVLHTMFEANRVTRAWVDQSLRHDLTVFPTSSSRDAWIASGMPRRRVAVCPEGVDVVSFDGSAPPEPLVLPGGRLVSSFRTRFLSVAVASPRKNLIGLLRAWMRATTMNDDAVLVLKCGPAQGEWMQLFRSQLRRLEHDLQRSLTTAAPVLLLDRTFADAELPKLYTAATHYIGMSFGEGWDQPMHEAAASNLALIAPDHSAYRDYISGRVADVIPSRPVPALFEGDPALLLYFAGAQWWEPDERVAAGYIRAAIDGTSRPKASARDAIALPYSWEQSTRRLLSVVDDLVTGRTRRRFGPRRPGSTHG